MQLKRLHFHAVLTIMKRKRFGELTNMNTLHINQVEIGNGAPKICIPVTSRDITELQKDLNRLGHRSFDLIEWRVDYFAPLPSNKTLEFALRMISDAFPRIPLLFTFRTQAEGGNSPAEPGDYKRIVQCAITSGYADLIDLEAFADAGTVDFLLETAHELGVAVVLSNHDYTGTPPREEIVSRLRYMQRTGADITKIAVMPQSIQDVLTLMEASVMMRETYADRPYITISMSELGRLTRIASELTGSAITFGTLTRASVPGQMEANQLRQILELLYEENASKPSELLRSIW